MKLAGKIWRDERLKFLIFLVLMTATSVAQILLWPSFSKMLPSMLENLPDVFKNFVSGMSEQGFTYFVITQQFLKIVGFFGAIYAVLLATNALIREIENSTITLLLAQPLSRASVYRQKYFGGLILLAVPTVISSLVTVPTASMVGEYLNPLNTAVAALLGFLILALLFTLIFTLTLFLEDQMQALSLGLSFAVVMNILVIFEETKRFSIYGWLDADMMVPLLEQGIMPWTVSLLILGLTAALALIGWYRFRNLNL